MRAPLARTLAVAALAAGCNAAPAAGAPCTRWDDGHVISLRAVDELDLLVVVDDSSGVEAVGLVLRHLPRLLEDLASGDHDRDGRRDAPSARSIHLGIVTSDMGAEGDAVFDCVDSGDGGILQTTGSGAGACAATYPPFHVVEPGGRSAADAVADLACLSGIRAGGCGFERPLDAMLRALDPATNPGFLREGAVLGVLVVTDEDDCSASDASFYDVDDPSLGDPGLRCGAHDALLRPLDSIIEGLLLVEPRHRASELALGVLAGVPPDALRVSPAEILRHPDMQRRVDPSLPTRYSPSCSGGEVGVAYPPRRLVELAQRLEGTIGRTGIGSVCASDYERTLAPFARALRDPLGGACLPTGLSVDGGLPTYEGCELLEVLPAGRRCEELAGRTRRGSERSGHEEREVCFLRALDREEALAGEAGWYHETRDTALPGSTLMDECGASGNRLVLVGGHSVVRAEYRLVCPLTVGPDGGPCE